MALENLNKSTSDEVVNALLDEKRKTKNMEIKIQQLEDQLSRFSHKYNGNSIHEFNDLQENYKKLKHQYQTTIVALTESQEETKALRGQQKTLKEIIDKVKKENHFAQERLNEAESQISILNKHLQIFKEDSKKYEDIQKTLQHYEEKDAQQLEKLIELYNKEKKASLELDQLRAQVSEKDKKALIEIEHLKQQISEIQKRNIFESDHLKAQYTEKEKKVTIEIENLRAQLDKDNKLRAEVDHLRSQLRDKDKLINECESLREQLKESEIKNEEIFHQIIDLKQKNSHLELSYTELQKSNADSSQHSEQLERVIQFLREKNEESQNECKQLESDLLIAQQSIDNFKKEASLQQDSYNEISKKLSMETEKLTNAQHHSAYLEEKYINFENQLIQKNDEIAKQQEFNAHLQKDLDLQIKLHEENKEVINFLEKQIKEIDIQIHQMTEEKNVHVATIEKQQQALQELKSTLQSTETAYETEMLQLKDQIKILQDQKNDYENETNEKIQDLNIGIQDLLREKELLENINQENQLKLTEYFSEKEELLKQINDNNQNLQDTLIERDTLNETITTLNQKLQEVEEEKDALCEQLILLKKVVEEERSKHIELEASFQELELNHGSVSKELQIQLAANDVLDKNIKDLNSIYHSKESNFQNEISLMKMELLEYKDKELKHRNDFNSQEMQLQETKQVLNVVTLQKDRIEEMYNQLRTDYERIQDIIEVLRKEKEYIKRELIERDEDKISLISKIKELNDLNSNLEKDLTVQKEKLLIIEENFEKSNEMYKKEHEKLCEENKKNNDLLLKFEDAKITLDKFMGDNKKFESIILELEKKETQLKDEKDTLTKEVYTLLQKYNHLEEEKEEALQKLENVEKQKAELTSIKIRQDREHEIALQDIKSFQSDVLELNQKCTEMEKEILNLSNLLDDSQASKKIMEKKFEELQNSSKQKEMNLEDLKREQQYILNEKTRIENEKIKFESEISQLKRKIEETESKAQIAQQHLAKKVKETTLLSEELEKKAKKNAELQQILTSTQHQINETRKNAETYLQEKRRLEDKIKEISSKTDSERQRWESKYDQVYKQLQDSHIENQKLLKQKNKLDQMQLILNNLSSFMNPSQLLSNERPHYESSLDRDVPTKIQFKEEIFQTAKELEKLNDPSFHNDNLETKLKFSNVENELIEEVSVTSNQSDDRHYQNLFDFNTHQSRHKKTFFD